MNRLLPFKLLNFFKGYLEGSRAMLFVGGIPWIIAVGVGMWSLMAFDTTPGGSGITSATWPSGTGIAFQGDRTNLVLKQAGWIA